MNKSTVLPSLLRVIGGFIIVCNLLGCSTRHVPASVYEAMLDQTTSEGAQVDAFKGSVALVVNITSKCGTTPQLQGLEELYQRFKGRGFVVLGFPADDFGAMDTKTNEDILSFCQQKFNVTFPVFGLSRVTGPKKNPVFRYLTEGTPPPFNEEVGFNFEKFLVGRDGMLVARFGSFTGPTSTRLIRAIEGALDAKH